MLVSIRFSIDLNFFYSWHRWGGASLVCYFIIQIQLTYFITDILIHLVQVQVESSFPFSTMLLSLSYASRYFVFQILSWLCFPLCGFGRFGKRRRIGGIWTADLPIRLPINPCKKHVVCNGPKKRCKGFLICFNDQIDFKIENYLTFVALSAIKLKLKFESDLLNHHAIMTHV